jgi:flagellin FlaB
MNFKNNHEYAFTGLEAAIVLIAFIVVAAVFGYVILGSGFLTSQKAEETVHTGVAQAMSTVQQSGSMSIQANAAGNGVKTIEFYLQLAASGTGAEMSAFGYTLSTAKNSTTFTANDVTYSWVKQVKEMVMVSITVPDDKQSDLGYGEKFMVEVKPALGASIPVAATVPGALSGNNWYDVV